MIVVDASVLANALANDQADGARVRSRLRGQRLTAPELIDLEVLSVWRRLAAAGALDVARARAALDALAALPMKRITHGPLRQRCWELRHNLSVYDAAYVALAERLQVTLVTADARLANAPGVRCTVELL